MIAGIRAVVFAAEPKLRVQADRENADVHVTDCPAVQPSPGGSQDRKHRRDAAPFVWAATADEILAKVAWVQANVKKLVDNNAK